MSVTTGVRNDTVVTPQGEVDGDPRFLGHTAALRDLQDFVQTRQIPYLGQWYSRIALQYLGVEITTNERVVEWADEGRYLIRQVHTHGEHVLSFSSDNQNEDLGQRQQHSWGSGASTSRKQNWVPGASASPEAAAPLQPNSQVNVTEAG
mmetsp:Transcript_118878/g.236875  ORF Transcript_118878/g.236875 Transcript_118878/m.236875 type:complete len:149 (+) Transcript_118878:72-518(+)